MSIVAPSERASWWAAKGPCFFCKLDIESGEVMVMWAGVGWVGAEDDGRNDAVDIALHRTCAAKIGAHLIADAREADLAAGDTVVWQRRSERLKKFQLERQEWKS